jgi:hypothetical protein
MRDEYGVCFAHLSLVAGLSLGLLSGCSSHGKDTTPPPAVLTIQEAQAIVDEERAAHGLPAPGPAPQSLADVVTILRRDEIFSFPQARDYLSSLPGVDALIVKGTLEMLWADGQLTVAALAREYAERREAEAVTLNETLKGQPNDAALKERLAQTTRTAEHERRLQRALVKLADPHFEAAMSIANEVERRNPERPESYSVHANLYRLHRDWNEFEHNMGQAEKRQPDRADVAYARALEQAARLSDRAGACDRLHALLVEVPDLARARAQLVLLQDDAEARYEELQALKALNPLHAVVLLEGRAIESEHNTAAELRALREQTK